ncbi:hypothetical protein MPTK1_1g18930 [Marchantia polymorpha subsp. ruderalis]|uniref:CCB4 n=2 Tax=Marchantia polymorpha TaxID=3197 RepID=A0AAF6ARQ5_MARPO|nr:hypothetical protein MARPO_0001s0231 [Marchantia polymorpha]BBM99125.1 hypothetical protein Mp_1g18930 [Marchantia polymorpha subsp. ruderalis]|eukprot:PTQ50202.1 hypothetical protein MARPO_0001s0231 [Marchantia polymorpha]
MQAIANSQALLGRWSGGCGSGALGRRRAHGLCVRSRLDGTPRDSGDGWVVENAETVRSVPLFVGGGSLAAILLNRAFSGISSIADASSAQSRADVLALALSATVVLTGLVWKSIDSKPQSPVALNGVECLRIASFLQADVVRELIWSWDSLEKATTATTMVVLYRNSCILQAGLAAESRDQGVPEIVDVDGVLKGSLYKAVKDSKKQNYLANLALYPGRFELSFLPSNTQAAILQPLGDDGILILGSNTLRGFGPNDQGWIVALGEKLDSALADAM